MDTPCRYRSVACLPRSSPARDRRESGQSHSKLLAHWVHRTLPAHHRDAGQQRGGRGRRQGRQAHDADPPRVGRQAPRLHARHLAPPGRARRRGVRPRCQRRHATRARLRVRPVYARAPPRRTGGRAPLHARAAGVRGVQRGRPHHALRGSGAARRPVAGSGLGLLVLRVRAQRRHALLRGPPHGPPRLIVRRDEEGRRGIDSGADEYEISMNTHEDEKLYKRNVMIRLNIVFDNKFNINYKIVID
jgi:hypothetical protein